MPALIAVGLGLYMFSGGISGRSIAIAVILFGFTLLVIDYLSEERAAVYYNQILAADEAAHKGVKQ